MLSSWLIYTLLIFVIVYLLIMLNYNKALYKKEQKSNLVIKDTLLDAEVLIRKYRVQLQRSIGNIDILTDELDKLKDDIKVLRTRNSQYRHENEQLLKKIKELEGKIDALI